MFRKKLLSILLCVAILPLLASCYGLKMVINFNNDDTGSMEMTQVFAEDFMDQLMTMQGQAITPEEMESQKSEILHEMEQEMVRALSSKEGILNVQVSNTLKKGNYNLVVRFDFTDFNEIPDLPGKMVLTREGEQRLLNIIMKSSEFFSEIAGADLSKVSFDGFNYELLINAPKPITFTGKKGSISNNKKSYKFSLPMSDLLNTKEDLIVDLKW